MQFGTKSRQLLFILCLCGLSAQSIDSAVADPQSPTTAPTDETVPNPLYQNWAAFAIGSTKTIHESSNGPDGHKIFERVLTLTEVSETRVVLQMSSTELHAAAEVTEAPATVVIPSQILKSNASTVDFAAPAEGTAGVDSGDDVILVNGEQLKCKWYQFSAAVKGVVSGESKVWLSPKIPGHVAKYSRSTKGSAASETTIETTSYLAKQIPGH